MKKMEMEKIASGFAVAASFLFATVVVLAFNYALLKKRYNEATKVKPPYCETFSYDEEKVTHIVSYEEAEPDKYIVVTTNGSYRVPQNFMLYHSGELLYVEEIATGNRNYSTQVQYYQRGIVTKTLIKEK